MKSLKKLISFLKWNMEAKLQTYFNLFFHKHGKFVVEYSPGFAVNPLIWNSGPASDLCHFERNIPTRYPSSKTKFDSEILEARFNEFPICAKTFSKPFKLLHCSVRLFSSSVLSENLIIWGSILFCWNYYVMFTDTTLTSVWNVNGS